MSNPFRRPVPPPPEPLTYAEIEALVVEKSLEDRLVSGLKGAIYTPLCVGLGGLAAPLGVFILITKPFSGGSGAAAALGNAAGMAMAVGSCIAGVAVYGTLLFGGPLALPILGGVLAAASAIGGVIGFRGKIDHEATRNLQRPHRQARWAFDHADEIAAKELESEKLRAKWAAEDAERARKREEQKLADAAALLREMAATDPDKVRALLDGPSPGPKDGAE